MIYITLNHGDFVQQRLHISISFPQPVQQFYIPFWRPGRYMQQWFTPLVKHLKGYDSCGNEVKMRLVTETCWQSDIPVSQIAYQFEAKTFDGGGSWVADDILYINPVNAIIYAEEFKETPIQLTIHVPNDFTLVCGKKIDQNTVQFAHYDELYDHPIVASNQLKSFAYQVAETPFTAWFYGLKNKTWTEEWLQENIQVFASFTQAQYDLFGSFPFPNFEFITLVPDYGFYHGVEHITSTMLVLGPPDRVLMPRSKDLWGVASHELFHCWNIKRIRPESMLPYDFSKQQFSQLGYVYEGFTTYFGDEILYRTGVFTLDDWMEEISARLLEHRSKPGRMEISLADSSVITWMGGYDAKYKNDRVSIYTEGMLNALIIDTLLARGSQHTIRLDHLMRLLWQDAQNGLGYNETRLIQHLQSLDPNYSWKLHFEQHYHTPIDLTEEVLVCLDFWGIGYRWNQEELQLFEKN